MLYNKEVKMSLETVKCDYCNKECIYDLPEDRQIIQPFIYRCAVCRKDMCEDHVGEATEDGHLCFKCAEKYTIDYGNGDEGVGVIDKETGKEIKSYL